MKILFSSGFSLFSDILMKNALKNWENARSVFRFVALQLHTNFIEGRNYAATLFIILFSTPESNFTGFLFLLLFSVRADNFSVIAFPTTR
jgi:hypothetical protein